MNTEYILDIIILLIGIIFGMRIHSLLTKPKNRKKKNPDYCIYKEDCKNHFCVATKEKCCYDLRDIL